MSAARGWRGRLLGVALGALVVVAGVGGSSLHAGARGSQELRSGLLYLRGIQVERDPAEAVYWFGQGAAKGDRDCQYRLGLCYLQGVGVERCLESSARWLRKAAAGGHREAREELRRVALRRQRPRRRAGSDTHGVQRTGLMAESEVPPPVGGEPDGEPGEDAEVGGEPAPASGEFEEDVEPGVEVPGAPADPEGDVEPEEDSTAAPEPLVIEPPPPLTDVPPEEVARWHPDAVKSSVELRASAPDGADEMRARADAAACGCYGGGKEEEARRWYARAHDAGSLQATLELARMYEEGGGGTRDLRRAAELYAAAAERGHWWGLFKLAMARLDGVGVDQDRARARDLLFRSAGDGERGVAFLVGVMMVLGEDLDHDETRALEWLRSAAGRGHTRAIGVVQWFPRQAGGPFLHQLVSPDDIHGTRRHLDLRARGRAFMRGLRHCPRPDDRAVLQSMEELLLSLGDFDDEWAFVGRGWQSEFGLGYPVDLRNAYQLYQSAADEHNAAGQAGLERVAEKSFAAKR